jgi:general stress protein 26
MAGGELWFFANEDSAMVRNITANPQVNVAISDPPAGRWVSVSGKATVVYDHARAQQLWSPAHRVFLEQGLRTPGLVLLRVQAMSAVYWNSSASKPVRVTSFDNAAVRN